MKRKALSVLFAVLMLLTACAVSAFAEEGDGYTAKIGDDFYASLEEAVAAVPADGTQTTITLLGDSSGNGIVVNEGQNVIIDFGGFTYTADGNQVGSTGTENLSFQLLKGADVTLRNGAITSTKTKMLIQNYSDLVLEDITLDGTQSDVNTYTLSNNFGSVLVKGETNIIGDEDTVAFDLWYGLFGIYDDGISVTFDEGFTGEVKGVIEYGAHSRVTAEDWTDKASLVIKGGNFDTEFVAVSDVDIKDANITISGGKFTAEVAQEYCADGYEPCTYADGSYGVCSHSVKKVSESKAKTCIEDGYDIIKCQSCEFSIVINYYSNGHDFSVYVSDSNATYSEDGTKTSVCGNGCGEKNTLPDVGSMLLVGIPATATATQTTDSITITWDAVANATGYRVFIRNEATNKWDIAVKTTGKKTTWTFSGLKAGTKYTYAVGAYVNTGTIIWAPSYITVKTATLPEVIKTVTSKSTASSVTLTWNKVNATGYRVFKWNATNKKWDTVVSATYGTSYTVKDLKAGESYIFAVRPYVNSGTHIIWASTYTKLTAATVAAAPTLKVLSSAAGRATIAWGKVSGATGYQVWYSTNATTGYTKVANYTNNSTYHTGLTSGKTYYYKVRAYQKTDSGYVYSGWSDVQSVKIK